MSISSVVFLTVQCVAKPVYMIPTASRGKPYMSLGGGANTFCGSKQSKCGKHAWSVDGAEHGRRHSFEHSS